MRNVLRGIAAAIVLSVALVSSVSAQYCTDCPTLGGHSTQTVLDYFKGISHPKFMFNFHDAGNVAALKAKATSGDATAAALWSAISNRSNLNILYRVGNASFYYNLMGGMTSTETGTFGSIVRNYDPEKNSPSAWNYPENLDKALLAYDCIAATSELSTAEKDAFLTKVLVQVTGMKTRTPAPGQSGNINEHSAHTLGLAAIVFADHADAYDWLDQSLKFLQYGFHEMTNEACIAEGNSYQLGAISNNIATLLITLEEHGFPVVDRADNFFQEMWTWMVKANRPTHQTPQTEDCWDDWTCGSIWPAKYIKNDTEVRRALQWHFKQVYDGGYSPKDYITYDPALNGTAPPAWNPTQFFPTSSCAVFRDGYGEDDTWLYLLGDRMPFLDTYASKGGWTHNKHHGHWDATSFTVQAHGEYLLTESGRFSGLYVNYHNMIMVDNDNQQPSWGISSNDKFSTLSNYVASDFMDAADITMTYADTRFIRTVLFPKKVTVSGENEYFVIIDDVEATDGENHFYDLQFHNSDGDITGANNLWTSATGGAVAELHILEPELDFAIRGTENVGGSVPYTDHYVKCRKGSAQSFQYITLIYPRTTGMASPVIAELNGTYLKGGTMSVGSTVDAVLSQKGNETETVGGVRTDARQALLRKNSGSVAGYFVKNATLLQSGSTVLLSADASVQLAALEYASNTRLAGTLVLDRGVGLTFKSADGAVSSWKYLGAGTYEDFSFDLEAGGVIAGSVTDDDLGTGIPNAKVEAVQGSDISYCYTDAAGDYRFDWVRPGATTVRFSRSGYVTASTTGQTVTAGATRTADKALAISTSAPSVTASILSTTTNSADIMVVTNKPCQVQVAYGATTSYGSQSVKTTSFSEAATVALSGLTPGQLYHYKVTAWDYDNRQGVTDDQEFFPVGAFSDDFADGGYTDKWETSSSYWSQSGGVVSKTSSGNFASSPKRLNDILFAKDVMYESFTLTAKGQSTRSSDKRDFSIVFNYEDDTHYYYAQFSGTLDDDYSGIFKVNGADKVKVGSATALCLPNTGWVDVKIIRDMRAGAVEVYCTDMTTPVYTLYDGDFGLGKIGLASERSTVAFDDISIEPGGTVSTIRLPGGMRMDASLALTVPNPVTGPGAVPVAVSWPEDGTAAPVGIEVLDMGGNRIETLYRGTTTGSLPTFAWNHAAQPAGVYYLTLTVGERMMVKRIVITK